MFKMHEVWNPLDDSRMQIYFCFEDLRTKKFAVQNLEWHGLSNYRNSDAREQTIELFIEEDPLSRCLWGNTLEEAITLFNEFMSS